MSSFEIDLEKESIEAIHQRIFQMTDFFKETLNEWNVTITVTSCSVLIGREKDKIPGNAME